MKKKIAAAFVGCGLLVGVAAEQACANAEDVGLYTVTRITSNDFVHDIMPSLNVESTLVWQREAPCSDGEDPCLEDYEIFMYSPMGGVVRVTDNDLEDYYPEINASGTIVWMSRFDADDDWEIWRKDPGSDEPVQMTNNEFDDKYPLVSDNGNIVWNTFDGTDWEISYAKAQSESAEDLWSSGESLYSTMDSGSSGGSTGGMDYTVTKNERDDYLTSGYLDYFAGELDYTRPFKDSSPRMSPDGKIAWMADDGEDFEVWSYDPATEIAMQITANSVDDRYPQINAAGDMVWEKFDGNDYGIAYLARQTSQEKYISMDEDGGNVWDDVHPKLNEAGDVAWQSFDGNDWEIGRYSAVSGQSEMVTDDTFDHLYHAINNHGDLAWLTWAPEENNDEPFILHFYDNTIQEAYGVTSFMSYFPYPRLNDNREISWWESEWQGYDVAIAKPNNPFHMRFLPNRLNKKSERRWAKVLIELPAAVDADAIDATTLCLKKINNIEVDEPVCTEGHSKIADFNGDGIDDLSFRLPAEELLEQLSPGTSELLITGRFWDGTPLYGTGVVNVKGRRHHHYDKKDDKRKKDQKKRRAERHKRN